MSMNNDAAREEFILSFDGAPVQNHEMDLEVLANSLSSFKKLATRTNTFVNGKDAIITVKAKGGFRQGSFEVAIILEQLGAIMPLIPQIIPYIQGLIQLRKFLKGAPPENTERTDRGIKVENTNGQTIIINAPIYAMHGNVSIGSDMGKFLKPLEEGIEKVSLRQVGLEEQTVDVDREHKDLFLPQPVEPVQHTYENKKLEVLTLNFDGKPDKWRFYDPENDFDFTAHINDAVFLRAVVDGIYNFQSGDLLTVRMQEIKKIINLRKRTDRIITDVLEYERPISL